MNYDRLIFIARVGDYTASEFSMVPSATNCLQTLLQTAVQSVQWTYSLLWQLCPQQGILVWGNGYYNGAIKTRKTVQPMEVSADPEEASLQRSQQLRELYDSLGTGDKSQSARRPSAALSPEDLTESEWFYLMCVSFSFPPGVGLPGKAYRKRKHVWLTGASEVDSKDFSRAILAKSARIQTVVCIPLLDGVVELGTTEKVQEDLGFVQQVKSFFIDHAIPPPQTPALSGHSSSNPAMSPTMPPMYTLVDPLAYATNQMDEEEEEEQEEEDNDNEENRDEEEEEESYAADQAETLCNSRFSSVQNLQAMADQDLSTAVDHGLAVAEPSELMHLDLSEDIRFGSPNDGSKNLDSDFHLLAVSQVGNVTADCQGRADSYRAESTPMLQDQNPLSNCLQLQASGPPSLKELTQKDPHYSHTLSTILYHQSNRWSNSCSARYALSSQSVFAKWTLNPSLLPRPTKATPQWVLKYILVTVPFLHTNSKCSNGATDSATRFRFGKATPQDELSANHMLAERRRREKLNERFVILRSLVPFVTKMDKASILGDTIEYLKQLRKKIQDLEARARQVELNQRPSIGAARMSSDKRKLQIVEGGGVGKPKDTTVVGHGKAMQVEVSIIESDALVELQCPYREGLLLDVMHVLRELLLEITTVQSSWNGGMFAVEMRAKVKQIVNRKRVSIMEVKRALDQIIPPH